LIIDLSQHPNILGIKDSSGNLSLLQEAYPSMRSGSAFLLGAGSILLSGLQLGASGGILTLAAVVPELCARLCALFKEQRWEQAVALQMDLVPLNQAVTKYYGVPGAKYALDLLGFHGGLCRLPLLPLEAQVKSEIAEILTTLNLI
jgi:4-hydroxy-2-oxoglutarate aldolase